MCSCFDLGYVLSNISDDGRTASTVQRDTSREHQRFLHQSASRSSSAYIYTLNHKNVTFYFWL